MDIAKQSLWHWAGLALSLRSYHKSKRNSGEVCFSLAVKQSGSKGCECFFFSNVEGVCLLRRKQAELSVRGEQREIDRKILLQRIAWEAMRKGIVEWIIATIEWRKIWEVERLVVLCIAIKCETFIGNHPLPWISWLCRMGVYACYFGGRCLNQEWKDWNV